MIGADQRYVPPLPSAEAPVTFEELYRADFARVVALVHGLSGSRAAAEELAQEAFLAAHRRWARVSRLDDPSAWVRRVAVNRGVSAARRRVAEVRALTRLSRARRPRPEPLEPEDEAFWAEVRRLPRRQAQALALHYVEDRPVAEIAAVLGCAEATVKVHLHRGRRALAARLRTTEEEDDGHHA